MRWYSGTKARYKGSSIVPNSRQSATLLGMQDFVERLALTSAPKDARNLWDYTIPANEIRRNNLIAYFTEMHKRKPKVLLIGEAPGYRGCGRVGVPFSSEKLLLSHPFFSGASAFTVENPDDPMGEASATIVWKAFDSLDVYPLMWATYPFHPHKPGNIFSNRAPRPNEVLLGKSFISEIMDNFNIKHVVAVGRVAEGTLREMGFEAYPVRHPSHGGAVLFQKGLSEFVERLR